MVAKLAKPEKQNKHAEFEARKSVATANEIQHWFYQHTFGLPVGQNILWSETVWKTPSNPMQVGFERQEGLRRTPFFKHHTIV